MQSASKFFADIVKTASSSGVQVLITLITTPLMTRLYEPAAYSTFGVIHTMATSVIGVGLLSLPNAYPIEKDPAKRIALAQLMLLLLAGLVVLSAIGAVAMAATDAFGLRSLAVMLLPILVFTFGIRQIMVSVAIESAHFNSISVGQILEPAIARGGSILMGVLMGGRASFILIAVALGHIATSLTVGKMVLQHTLGNWRVLVSSRLHPVRLIREFSDFVIYSTCSQQAKPLAMLGIQLVVIACFSHDVAGHYILAISILTLPASVVALATAPVVYRNFIETDRTDPAKLSGDLKRATCLYLAAGAVTLSPIFFFGEPLFEFVFGKIWGEAGRAASLLSIAYVAAFAMTGVQSIFRVTKRLKTQFFLELVTAALTLVAVLLSFRHLDFDTAMYYLAIILAIRNIVLLVACIVVTDTHVHSTIREA